MDIINYLEQAYGYNKPIILKDVRIGGKSKTAVKESFYRATKEGLLSRDGPGVYSLTKKDDLFSGAVTFEKVLESKFLYSLDTREELKQLFVAGYYSGLTFLNKIGISQQVPAILEVTTNRTKSKKRFYYALGRIAIIRQSKTEINFQNYKILQFLDMFHFISMDEVIKYKDLLRKYIVDNYLTKNNFMKYISLYGTQTIKKIVEGGIIDAFIE